METQQVWQPVSHLNCSEAHFNKWQSIEAHNKPDASPYLEKLADRRVTEKDVNQWQHRREDAANSAKATLHHRIREHNQTSANDIKLLTSRLYAYLDDVMTNVKNSKFCDEIILNWKEEWDENIKQWSFDVYDVLSRLKDNFTQALKECGAAMISAAKCTPALVDSFLTEQVSALNQSILLNEMMYVDVEQCLKLSFDSILRDWLMSEDGIMFRSVEGESDSTVVSFDERVTLEEIFTLLDLMFTQLDEDEPEFTTITRLNHYLHHLRISQNHVKLFLKEALMYLKDHLERQDETIIKEDTKNVLQGLWLDIVNILKEQLEEIKNYNKESANSWNQFIKRLHCAERTAHQAIYKLRSTKLANELAAEQTINCYLDQIRESSNSSYSEQTHNQVLNELEKLEMNLLTVRDDEDKIILHLINACFAAYDVFSAQVSLLNDPQQSDPNYTCTEIDLDEASEITNPEILRMKYCIYSAQTWIDGVKETLLMLDAELPKFLKVFLENMMCVYKGENEYWLMLQLEKLSKRKQRIKQNVVDIRAAELKEHYSLQRRLLNGIDAQLKKIEDDAARLNNHIKQQDHQTLALLEAEASLAPQIPPQKKLYEAKKTEMLLKYEQDRARNVHLVKLDIERVFQWISDTCSTYLSTIRLFHEGGNYNSEECDVALRKISHLTGALPNRKDKTVKKLEALLIAAQDAFKKDLAKISYPSPSEEEILRATMDEANLQLEFLFNQLKDWIRSETQRAAKMLSTIKLNFDEAVNADSKDEWLKVMNEAESNCNYFALSMSFPGLDIAELFQTVEESDVGTTVSTPWKSEGRKGGRKVHSGVSKPRKSKPPRSHSPKSRSTRSRSARKSDESGRSTFKSRKTRAAHKSAASAGSTKKHKKKKRGKPSVASAASVGSVDDSFEPRNFTKIDEDNYLTNVKLLINGAFSKLSSVVHDIKSVKLASSKSASAAFKLRAVACLRHYNLQVESVWTHLAKDYFNVLNLIYSKTLQSLRDMENRFVHDFTTEAMKLEHSHRLGISNLSFDAIKEGLDNKLKPWHGYPLNKPLLQELLKDVTSFCKEQLTLRKVVNETFRDELKSIIAQNKADAVEVCKDGRYLIEKLFCNETINSRCKNMKNYAKRFQFGEIIRNPPGVKKLIFDYCFKPGRSLLQDGRPEMPYEFDKIDFSASINHKFMNFIQNLIAIKTVMEAIPDEDILYGQEAIETQQLHNSDWEESERLELVDTSPIWQNFNVEIKTQVEHFQSAAIQNLKLAKREFDGVARDLVRWKNEWVSNIKEVNRLYLINPILNHHTRRISELIKPLKKPPEDLPEE